MVRSLQRLSRGQRLLIYLLIIVGVFFLVAAIAVFVALLIINEAARPVGRAVVDTVTVREFAILPDDNAYPAAVAVAPDGTVYTGSYDTGAIWSITPDGVVTEVPNTREIIGAVTGLTVAADGTVYVLDRLVANPRSGGGALWEIADNNLVLEYGEMLDDSGFISPDDITTDPAGNVYVSDRGRREVWRFDAEGVGSLWWVPPDAEHNGTPVLPTGLAYNPMTDSIIISDSETGWVYSVSLDGQTTEILYENLAGEGNPGFDGLSVGDDGTIYIAALANREVIALRPDGTLTTLANNFRGVSDVEFYQDRLYITNFDQRSLVLPGIVPQLPFALDVMTFLSGDS